MSDWQKKDWLDRAKEPSDGWKVALWFGAAAALIVGGVAAFFLAL
jgi:hypothetical protein